MRGIVVDPLRVPGGYPLAKQRRASIYLLYCIYTVYSLLCGDNGGDSLHCVSTKPTRPAHPLWIQLFVLGSIIVPLPGVMLLSSYRDHSSELYSLEGLGRMQYCPMLLGRVLVPRRVFDLQRHTRDHSAHPDSKLQRDVLLASTKPNDTLADRKLTAQPAIARSHRFINRIRYLILKAGTLLLYRYTTHGVTDRVPLRIVVYPLPS